MTECPERKIGDTLANPLLASFNPEERAKVEQMTKHLTAALTSYFADYPAFDPVRFPATALTSAAENPTLAASVLEQIVRVPAWIFTIDAVIDEKLMDEPQLRRQLQVYEQIVLGVRQAVTVDDQYGQVLLAIRRALAQRPNFPHLKDLWTETYIRMIRGMLFETYDRVAHPTWDEYLTHGRYSIGLPTYIVSTWILQTDEDISPKLGDLLQMMELSGTAIRLANDLRTFAKEEQEDSLNAIFVQEHLLRASGCDEVGLRERAFATVRTALHEVFQAFTAMVDPADPLKRALGRLTEFSVGFYHEQDFHTVNETDVIDLLRTPTQASRERAKI